MIKNFIKTYEYYEDINIKNLNTYRLDVKCKYLVYPKEEEELVNLLKYLNNNNYKYLVLGNGSNIIFKNNYYDGVIIKLDRFNKIKIDGNIITVKAGCPLVKLSEIASKKGLSGLEFASAIPGVIGASVAMNAGAYNEDIAGILISAKVLTPNLECVTYYNNELDFTYRDSFIKKNKHYIVLECKLKLKKGNREDIVKVIKARRKRRIETQPLNYPQAGSVFRNPPSNKAGALIEECGLKGYKIGGAMVSEKHANFIINYDNATGDDIIKLIDYIKTKVYNKYNIDLVLEQIIIE